MCGFLMKSNATPTMSSYGLMFCSSVIWFLHFDPRIYDCFFMLFAYSYAGIATPITILLSNARVKMYFLFK